MIVTNISEESSSLLIGSTIPRLPLISNQNPNSSLPKNPTDSSHCNFTSHHGTNLLPLNHHLANLGGDGKSTTRTSEFIDRQPELEISSRWNPTPEQLLALEEIYRRGTRTPSSEQIQIIALQLRRFGKIEGKNVFYWFQNHKARERQKRRRREMVTNHIPSDHEKQRNINTNHNIPADKKEPGLRTTIYDIGQTRNWAPSSNSEEFVSMQQQQQHRVSDFSSSTSCGPRSYYNGWSRSDQREFQVQQIRKSTRNVMSAALQEIECFPSSLECKKLLQIDRHQKNLSGFSYLNMKPYIYQQENGEEPHQTLELFPLHDHSNKDDDDDGNSNVNGTKKVHITAMNDTNNFSPSSFQYIEFLPLKKN